MKKIGTISILLVLIFSASPLFAKEFFGNDYYSEKENWTKEVDSDPALDAVNKSLSILSEKIDKGTFSKEDEKALDNLTAFLEKIAKAKDADERSKAQPLANGVKFFQHEFAGARTFYFLRSFSDKEVIGLFTRKPEECPAPELSKLWNNNKIDLIKVDGNAIGIILNSENWDDEIIKEIISLNGNQAASSRDCECFGMSNGFHVDFYNCYRKVVKFLDSWKGKMEKENDLKPEKSPERGPGELRKI